MIKSSKKKNIKSQIQENKEGCGRIYVPKILNYLLYSYSIELSHLPRRPDRRKALSLRYSSFDRAVI